MTEEEQQFILMCSLWAEAFPFTGTIKGFCQDCRREIAVSLQGQALITEHPTAIAVCLDCMKVRIKEDPSGTVQPPLPGTVEAIKNEAGIDISAVVQKVVGMPLAELDLDEWR